VLEPSISVEINSTSSPHLPNTVDLAYVASLI